MTPWVALALRLADLALAVAQHVTPARRARESMAARREALRRKRAAMRRT